MTDYKEPDLSELNPDNIICSQQNNPELVIMDCKKEFNLSENQLEQLRLILIRRGINKSLHTRREFIKLKHEVKQRLKESIVKSREYYIYFWLNERMQNIAKTPRWVEFPKTVTHNWKNIERDIKIKGERM